MAGPSPFASDSNGTKSVAHLRTLRFSRKEKECSERVPSKNAKVDREHRDSPEHSSSQSRPCKHRRTCDFCVSRFSHDFREHIPLPGIRLRPLRILSTLRSGKIPVFLHAASNVADCLEHFQNRIRRVGRCTHSESSPDFPQTTSAPANRYVIGIQRASRNAGTISSATVIASAGVPVAKRISVASSMINESNIVLIAV